MACDRRYKYIYSAADQKEYLLDHAVDAEETRNRAYNPLHADATGAMRARVIGFFRGEGYTDPLDGDDWKTFPKLTLPDSPDAGLLLQDAGWAMPHYHIEGYGDRK